MSYYRTSGKTARAKCGNCGRPFKEHKYVTTDRDGDLHGCPKPRRARVRWTTRQGRYGSVPPNDSGEL